MQQNHPVRNPQFTIKQIECLDAIRAEDWNRLLATDNPFLTFEFLQGLEYCDCLQSHGWVPNHLTVYQDEKLVGAMPLYLKSNSYGEFVFDWAWADAYERAGGRYYPKLVSAIPFTPVCGPRFLIDAMAGQPDTIRNLLIQSTLAIAESAEISSYHCLFPDQADELFCAQHKLLSRSGIQFHWHNRDYRDFDDFLDSLNSKRRKQIKRERRQVVEADLDIEILTGDHISDYQWQVFYEFYCSTFHRRWGSPRLTLDFFKLLSTRLPRQTILILARKNREYVAGAFAMRGGDTLYGRHWGCTEHYPSLHFELCYYQTINYCINNRLANLDAGVQGEHKLSRGFEPVVTRSSHWLRHQGFRRAVSEFLNHERQEIDAYKLQLLGHLPYKTGSPVNH